MRNLLLLIAFSLTIGVSGGIAQICTPIPIPLPGVYPNPLVTPDLPDGDVGVNYSTTITLVVVEDTMIDLSVFYPGLPTIPVSVDYQKINNISGLPNALTYACDIPTCEVPGNGSGCALISGIPDSAGTYAVELESVIGFTVPASIPIIGGTVQEIPVPGVGWNMEVQNNVGIEELETDRFSVVQNGPNPFRGSTEIHFNSPKPTKVLFSVMDISGHVLHTRTERASVGENILRFDAEGYAPGIYLYRLSNGEQAITQKMIVID